MRDAGAEHLLAGMIVTADVVFARGTDRETMRDRIAVELRLVGALAMFGPGEKVRGRGAERS